MYLDTTWVVTSGLPDRHECVLLPNVSKQHNWLSRSRIVEQESQWAVNVKNDKLVQKFSNGVEVFCCLRKEINGWCVHLVKLVISLRRFLQNFLCCVEEKNFMEWQSEKPSISSGWLLPIVQLFESWRSVFALRRGKMICVLLSWLHRMKQANSNFIRGSEPLSSVLSTWAQTQFSFP